MACGAAVLVFGGFKPFLEGFAPLSMGWVLCGVEVRSGGVYGAKTSIVRYPQAYFSGFSLAAWSMFDSHC